jgi:hypothetical protein
MCSCSIWILTGWGGSLKPRSQNETWATHPLLCGEIHNQELFSTPAAVAPATYTWSGNLDCFAVLLNIL